MPIGEPIQIQAPPGLPPVHLTADNPTTAESISLGRSLDYDTIFSQERKDLVVFLESPTGGIPPGVGSTRLIEAHGKDARETAKRKFLDELDNFVLFHLGSDARVEVDLGDSGLSAEISHLRVKSFRMELSWERVQALTGADERLEDFLLDQLTIHRR